MSGRITNYGSELILKAVFGRSAEIPQTLYIALILDEEPTPMKSGSDLDEPQTDSYARAVFINSDVNWTISGTEMVTNATQIEFPIATEDWGTVNYFAICDKNVGGNVIAYGDLFSSHEIQENDQVLVALGGVSFTLFNAAYEGD